MTGVNFLLGLKWHAMLADLECGEIFRLKGLMAIMKRALT
jgi:hypothetical protein